MDKAYSYDELASILGCSRTAIAKKVIKDSDNPSVERYKNRYDVVLRNGKKCILIDDEALEEEKQNSRGFKNVSNNSYNTPVNEDIIDIEPERHEKQSNKVMEFTERYIDKFTTLQETMYNELRNRDNQILLLTTSENKRQEEYFKTSAENKQLKEKNNVLLKVIITLGTLLVIVLSSFITFAISWNNVSSNLPNVSGDVLNVQKQVINDKKPVEVQEVVTPPAPQQVKK